MTTEPGGRSPWHGCSFDELAAQQGTERPINVAGLYDTEATDEERDAFMAAMEELDGHSDETKTLKETQSAPPTGA